MAKYDMGALMKCELLDAAKAAQGFPSRERFWVALTELCSNAVHYLRAYTPSVVIYGEEMQRMFLKELREVEALVTSLRVKSTPSVLKSITDAVSKKDESTLKDLLRVFYAEMNILRQQILDTLIPEAPVVKATEAPLIMVVDDMPEILTGMAEILLGSYRVIALPDARSAMVALEKQVPALFLLDIDMPDINGYELAKYIRARGQFQKTPILFLSGKGTREHVLAAMLHGGNDFLLKPVGKNELIRKVKQYIT